MEHDPTSVTGVDVSLMRSVEARHDLAPSIRCFPRSTDHPDPWYLQAGVPCPPDTLFLDCWRFIGLAAFTNANQSTT